MSQIKSMPQRFTFGPFIVGEELKGFPLGDQMIMKVPNALNIPYDNAAAEMYSQVTHSISSCDDVTQIYYKLAYQLAWFQHTINEKIRLIEKYLCHSTETPPLVEVLEVIKNLKQFDKDKEFNTIEQISAKYLGKSTEEANKLFNQMFHDTYAIKIHHYFINGALITLAVEKDFYNLCKANGSYMLEFLKNKLPDLTKQFEEESFRLLQTDLQR